MATLTLVEPTWERMYGQVEITRQRLLRTVRILEGAAIPYAVVGGHAIATWVARVDDSRVRATYDVDILVSRNNLEAVKSAMVDDGFIYAEILDVHLFIEDKTVKAGHGVHLLFAGEKIKLDSITAAPTLSESEPSEHFRVLSLEALVRMKLEANRRKDGMHLVDLMNVGLIDHTWLDKYPSPLKERLEVILDDDNEKFGFQ